MEVQKIRLLEYEAKQIFSEFDIPLANRLVIEKGDNIKEKMQVSFTEGKFADGLQKGILMAGEQLKEHFPYQDDDVNELSDDISFGGKQ